MKAGDVICVKKSVIFPKKATKFSLESSRESVWNDYSSGEMNQFTFSPEVYDMMLLGDASSFLIENHQKGYTMQEFIPFFDGSKIFKKNGKYYQNWEHQKNYLLTVFQSVLNLLQRGICMTNLKPNNTLYDAENGRGMLIDLAGVVRVDNKEKLTKFKEKDIKEVTETFANPLIFEKGDDETIDLFKCTAFAFGRFIQTIALNLEEKQFQPHHLILKKLSQDLMSDERETQRITIEEGLQILGDIKVKSSMATDSSNESLLLQSL